MPWARPSAASRSSNSLNALLAELARAEGLPGQSLDHRHDVGDPVVELVDQQLALLLGALAVGDVDRDGDPPDELSVVVEDRRGGRFTGPRPPSRQPDVELHRLDRSPFGDRSLKGQLVGGERPAVPDELYLAAIGLGFGRRRRNIVAGSGFELAVQGRVAIDPRQRSDRRKNSAPPAPPRPVPGAGEGFARGPGQSRDQRRGAACRSGSAAEGCRRAGLPVPDAAP